MKVRGLGERLERVVARRGLLQKDKQAAPPGAGRSRLAQTKQQLCLEFAQRGRCTHGARCVFAHGAHQLAEPPEPPKGDEQPPEPPKASAAVDALFAQRLAAARLACTDTLAATHTLEEGQLEVGGRRRGGWRKGYGPTRRPSRSACLLRRRAWARRARRARCCWSSSATRCARRGAHQRR